MDRDINIDKLEGKYQGNSPVNILRQCRKCPDSSAYDILNTCQGTLEMGFYIMLNDDARMTCWLWTRSTTLSQLNLQWVSIATVCPLQQTVSCLVHTFTLDTILGITKSDEIKSINFIIAKMESSSIVVHGCSFRFKSQMFYMAWHRCECSVHSISCRLHSLRVLNSRCKCPMSHLAVDIISIWKILNIFTSTCTNNHM